MEQAYACDARLAVVNPGIPGPSDGHLAGHRLGVVGDHGIGFPAGRALGALGFVVVADADHIARFQEPCRDVLADQIASHELHRRIAGYCRYICKTPAYQPWVTGTE